MVVQHQHTTARGEYTLTVTFANERTKNEWIDDVCFHIAEISDILLNHLLGDIDETVFREMAFHEITFLRSFRDSWGQERVPPEMVKAMTFLQAYILQTPERKRRPKKQKKKLTEQDEKAVIARALVPMTRRTLEDVTEALVRAVTVDTTSAPYNWKMADPQRPIDVTVILQSWGVFTLVPRKIPDGNDFPDISGLSEEEKLATMLVETIERYSCRHYEIYGSDTEDHSSRPLNILIWNCRCKGNIVNPPESVPEPTLRRSTRTRVPPKPSYVPSMFGKTYA